MDDHWKRLITAFGKAIEMPTAERADYLSGVRLDDQTLYTELIDLISADQRVDAFLDQPISVDLNASLIGAKIGHYLIREELGRGGMGAVFSAIRADGSFDQQVAIKISNRILLSSDLERRFKIERQILARLEHPNIVRLLDGGVTADKVPYFVMELIDGVRLTEFCERNGSSLEERLLLFQQVLSAVHYAHQHLVVHRDLKPSNILVTNEGVVKLLDFGIAKVLGDEAQTHTVNTPITPEYASPEQILDAPVSTVSDVYTLGVVLCELLTEKTPAEIYGVGRTDISRGIREVDPQIPSSLSGRMPLKDDLDNIILKCLEKDASQRYASADQLSDDIDRYLKGYPVAAFSRSFVYRAKKFGRRNKLLVTVASSAIVLLLATTSLAIWQAAVARHEQVRAEANFTQVRKIANSLILDYDDELSKLPGSINLRERLVSDAVNYLDAISSNETEDADLLKEMAIAYRKISSVQGMLYAANVGKPQESIVNANKGIQLLARAVKIRQDRLDLLDESAASLAAFSQVLRRTTRDAGKFATTAREINEIAIAADPENIDRKVTGIGLRGIEIDSQTQVDYAKTPLIEIDLSQLAKYLEALKKGEELNALQPNNPKLLQTLSALANRISNVNRWIGLRHFIKEQRPDLAKPYLEESIAATEKAHAYSKAYIKVTAAPTRQLRNQFDDEIATAIALPFLGRFADAEKHRMRAIGLLEKLREQQPNNIEIKIDELSILKNRLDVAALKNRPKDALEIAKYGLSLLDEYDRLTDSARNLEALAWRGYLLNMRLTSLVRLNGDKAEIAKIEAKLREIENIQIIAGNDPDGWSGIGLG